MAVLIIKPLTQDTIFKLNSAKSMIPASNTKLFTTAAALTVLGGDFKLSTKILADDNSLADSIINGNLYIKGFGNSLFTSSDMDSLINVLLKKGIKKISGDIIGDDTYFDNIYRRKDWINEEQANVTLPPVSALVIDRNRKIIYRRRRGRLRAYFTNVSDPPLYVAEVLKNRLKEKGIDINGKALKSQNQM